MRIRKLRLFALLLGLGVLAAVSTVFGMMMAVASDLPTLDRPATRNSMLVDRNGKRIGLLTGNQKRLFLREEQIAPVMKQAIIAIEDQRFYTNDGVDLRGIGRALYQDIVQQRVVQGGSTITQQFVKNALAAQDERTIFQKLRESAMAYHLTRKWTKEEILRNYLNTIYFGNGAYGIEAAARTYFQASHQGCDEKGDEPSRARRSCCPTRPRCWPAWSPRRPATTRSSTPTPRATGATPCSRRCSSRTCSPRTSTTTRSCEPLPDRGDLQPPVEEGQYPYFTSWVRQQVVDRLGGGQEGARRAFEGGLKVETTISGKMQAAAESAVDQWLPNRDGPRAALVALENKSGEVLAMVGGDEYNELPFNLATQGQRQPGSSIKPFILAEALRQGISTDSVWSSRKLEIDVPRSKGEVFTVNNYEDAYAGITTLARATTFSDNSVYAQVGIKVGTKKSPGSPSGWASAPTSRRTTR